MGIDRRWHRRTQPAGAPQALYWLAQAPSAENFVTVAPIKRTPGLQAAIDQLMAGRPQEARGFAERELRETPGSLEALEVLAESCRLGEDLGAAIDALKRADSVGKSSAERRAAIGALLIQLNDKGAAERWFRKALELDRHCLPAARDLALLLSGSERHQEAVQTLAPLLAGARADEAVLTVYAAALAGENRMKEALETRQRTVQLYPKSAVAEHNLGALLGDMGFFPEARGAVERALAKGLQAPETYLVYARTLAALGDHESADTVFRRILAHRPFWPEAQREFAQLVWMRTSDVDRALDALNAALNQSGAPPDLKRLKAKILYDCGDEDGAAQALLQAATEHPESVEIALDAAQTFVMTGRAQAGHAQALRALSLTDDGVAASSVLITAFLALGDAPAALKRAEALVEKDPTSQHAIAYLATAARLCGDPRYADLYDYGAFVRSYQIAAPSGWSGTQDYLGDLAAALNAAHRPLAHPFNQSVRGGSQVPNLFSRPELVLRAFPEAIAPAIRAYLDALGKGRDLFRRRNGGDVEVVGSWSVRLKGGNGRHVNHIHQEGWISSAFHVELPATTGGLEKLGWLTFGEPGIPTAPSLPPERFVRPEPGRLVLFPSYMWHGTTSFPGDEPRLSIAFDVQPKTLR